MINWIDLTIIGLLVLFALEGRGKSFMGEVFYLASFVVSFFLSLRFYNYLAQVFQNGLDLPHSLSNVIGFILVWFLVESVAFPIIYFSMPKLKVLFKADHKLRYLSWIPAGLRGLIFISILLVLVGTFPVQPRLKQAVIESKVGSMILRSTSDLEAPLKSVFGGITQDTLSFLTIKPKSDERVDLGFTLNNFSPDSSLEQQMIQLVNQERSSRGLKVLAYNPQLTPIGRGHSSDMFKRGYFSHYSPEGWSVADRAQQAKYDFAVIGENLAYAPNLELAHRGLMNSPGHRANILSEDFNQVGIGIMDGGVYGLMVTQVFSN